jgi:peptide/histidine transporter 3/4
MGLVLVQENIGWGLGFGIPTVFMGLAIVSFFFGTPLYRFQKPRGSPVTRVCQVLVAAFHKMNLTVPQDPTLLFQNETQHIKYSHDYNCLDKAAVLSAQEDVSDQWRLCSVTQVEEVKILIRMFPIWASGIVFSSLYSQISTLFVQQGRAMDCEIGSFKIPPATLAVFDCISVLIWVPLYDRLIVPLARRFTGNDKGFTVLQRMGIGLFVSILGIASAAMVEIARLRNAESGNAVSLTVFWQVPQYFILGAAEVFYFVGQLEFFYDQSPDSMRSLCSALGQLTFAFGSYLSSLIVTVVTYFTTVDGGGGWIADDLDEGHLDYFFWLLAGLSSLNAAVYVSSAVNYKQKL